MSALQVLTQGIPLDPIPPKENCELDQTVSHAPKRKDLLSNGEKQLALRNALRYFPAKHHAELAKEFADELRTYGRIYMHRFRPRSYEMKAYPIDEYPGKSKSGRAIMLMIMNNLDNRVAQHPHELITYGGNGAVFQNWAQYLLVMKYLTELTDEQTLVVYSGHPMGLFPSHSGAPRCVVTNGMVIPNYSRADDYEKFNALGVSQYGQMTAGSYMYIGPQGIVHGTTITVLNASRMVRKKRNQNVEKSASGLLFVTSGLGGMSGAQPKAGNIAGCVTICAEVDPIAAEKRHKQGWVDEIVKGKESLPNLKMQVQECISQKKAKSFAYLGNIVDLWEFLYNEKVQVDLGSDQSSLHNPWAGGYYPVDIPFEESRKMMAEDPKLFKEKVEATLRRHANVINKLCTERGMYFFDYGNAFLLQCKNAGADIMIKDLKRASGERFKYPSYVEDIMGPMCFDYGFGPFRWVCGSGLEEDLAVTDQIACEVLECIANNAPKEIQQQLRDNITWIKGARANRLVVGSQARILYADAEGRSKIALEFNKAIKEGRLRGPVILGRDHHDVSGTDSPYRETSNIYDGSSFTADMAIQNVIGDAARGATWVSVHNGGGVGWGEVINGGFGMVLDGSDEQGGKTARMLHWDVFNGIGRRCWARNEGSRFAIEREMKGNDSFRLTLPNVIVDEEVIGREFPVGRL